MTRRSFQGGVAVAALALVSCGAVGALASACNALSGISDFGVVSEAGQEEGPDRRADDGFSGGEGASPYDAGGSDVVVPAEGGDGGNGRDGTVSASDAGNDSSGGAGDAAGDTGGGASDAAGDVGGGAGDAAIDTGGGGAGDAGSDAENDAGTCGASATRCDGGCPIAHSNGLGELFYDCAPLATMNMTQAFEACAAHTGDATLCTNDPIGCANADEVCSTGTSICACWNYNGLHVGKVYVSTSATCSCYVSNAPSWN